MKPTPTTCIATSFEIPNKLHATGINKSEPPVTPEAPHADTAATTLNKNAVGKSTVIPKVFTAAKVRILIVIAAPQPY